MRVVAISDIHVDMMENRAWLERLCSVRHRDEVIIVAGDIASTLDRISEVLQQLSESYDRVFFVPGNHDLWVGQSSELDSLQRFEELMALCSTNGIDTKSSILSNRSGDTVAAILPLFSWYAGPDAGPGSLFHPKEGEDASLSMWADRVRIRWPETMGCPVRYFLELNQGVDCLPSQVPVISVSHFLPRQELIFSSPAERAQIGGKGFDRAPRFNFSRVAGTSEIDRQLRAMGSQMHVYGHQHRNRDRVIEGVRYLSHCLGYPQERAMVGVRAEEIEPKEIFRYS